MHSPLGTDEESPALSRNQMYEIGNTQPIKKTNLSMLLEDARNENEIQQRSFDKRTTRNKKPQQLLESIQASPSKLAKIVDKAPMF